MTAELLERMAIREVIENWVFWRDSWDFARLATTYHPDGRMHVSWFQGPAAEFIRHAGGPRPRGGSSGHFLGGTTIELGGERAIAESKVMILIRATIEGVPCDATAQARFYDFFEKRDGRWAIALRETIYEKDRIDAIDPTGPRPQLHPALLAQYPEGYRHFAYMQVKAGYTPKRDMPGARGPELERLRARGTRWLAGGALEIE